MKGGEGGDGGSWRTWIRLRQLHSWALDNPLSCCYSASFDHTNLQ